jgi:hypothetical protein
VQGGVVHACLKTKGTKKTVGTLRVVNAAKECHRKRGETAIAWNLAGTSGTPGTSGGGTEGSTGQAR